MIHIRLASLSERMVKDHWERTVKNKVNIDEIREYLTLQQIEILTERGIRDFNFWGDTDATLRKTKQVESGENIIFYGNKSFHLKAISGPVFENERLAKYLWSEMEDGNTWRNIYVLNQITDLNITYNSSDFLLNDGSPRQAQLFRSASYLEDFQLMPEFKSKLEICSDEVVVSDAHTRRGIPRDVLINRAQIYEVTFSVDGKNMIYIGQDLKCEDSYFGSSLIIYHFKKIYGEEIFNKRIIEDLSNLTKGEINDLEIEHISEAKELIRDRENWFSINYTGLNQRQSR